MDAPRLSETQQTLKPNRRWHRTLAFLATGVHDRASIITAASSNDRPRRLERRRTGLALIRLHHLGLIESIPGWGWTATPEGLKALETVQ